MGRSQVPLGADGIQQIKKLAPLIATLNSMRFTPARYGGRYNRQCRLGGKRDLQERRIERNRLWRLGIW